MPVPQLARQKIRSMHQASSSEVIMASTCIMFDTEGLDYVRKAFTCICSTKLLSCILFDKHINENLILSDKLKSPAKPKSKPFGHTDLPIAILVAYFCQLPLGPKGKLFEGMKDICQTNIKHDLFVK